MQHVFFIVLLVFISICSILDGVECGDGLEYWDKEKSNQQKKKKKSHAGRPPIDFRSNDSYRRNIRANKKQNHPTSIGIFENIESEEPIKANLAFNRNRGKIKEKTKQALRSTRMTPMHLMQQDEETTTIKSNVNKIDTGDQYVLELLNSYGALSEFKCKVSAKTISYKAKNYLKQMKILYDTLEQEVKGQMEKLLANYQGVNSTVEVIGRSVEYNDIVLLKLTEEKRKRFRAEDNKYVDEIPDKKVVFIVHGLSAMGMYELPCLTGPKFETLLEFYMKQLGYFDIFLIPLANPDAFDKLFWNKNYSLQKACNGVMLDRNFDVSWNNSKILNSCSQFFPGPSPFSEIETRVIRNVFHHYSHKIVAYFHVHAGQYTHSTLKGDAILYPRGYTDVASDDDKYIDLKAEVDEALRNASFQTASVQVETLHNWYGKVLGSSVDYASSIYGIPYAMELVMQIYKEELQLAALEKVWGRVIDAIFFNIHKSTITANEVLRVK